MSKIFLFSFSFEHTNKLYALSILNEMVNLCPYVHGCHNNLTLWVSAFLLLFFVNVNVNAVCNIWLNKVHAQKLICLKSLIIQNPHRCRVFLLSQPSVMDSLSNPLKSSRYPLSYVLPLATFTGKRDFFSCYLR